MSATRRRGLGERRAGGVRQLGQLPLNCTPQCEGFNRDAFEYHGLWGRLENHISKQAGFVGNRIILLAGPVLSTDCQTPIGG